MKSYIWFLLDFHCNGLELSSSLGILLLLLLKHSLAISEDHFAERHCDRLSLLVFLATGNGNFQLQTEQKQYKYMCDEVLGRVISLSHPLCASLQCIMFSRLQYIQHS